MDVSRFMDLEIAPRAVFKDLESKKDQPRFFVADGASWRPVTWGTFAAEVKELALFLATILKPGDRGAVFAPNRVEWASAALAIQAAGGVIVPIYPASTVEAVSYVASHSDAKVIFVDTPALVARLAQAKDALGLVEKIVLLDDRLDGTALGDKAISIREARAIGAAVDAKDPKALDRLMDSVSLDQNGMMLYTSGTSGMPKGVPLTHRNVGVNGRDWLKCNGPLLGEKGIDVLWLPMSHIFGFGELCLGNMLGWTSYLSDPATCLTKLAELKPTVFMSVPSHWEKLAIKAMHEPTADARLAKFKASTGGRLEFCLSGGAGLKREVKDFFYACGVLIIEGYGLTETSPTLTLNRPDSFRFDSVGKAIPSVELKLADDGEILAKGENVFKGYHKDEAATNACFTADGWFMTGDVGRFTDDGFLQIIDRKKDILVTAGGKNVPPANIEIRFRDDPHIGNVVVYGEGKKFLVAGVWLNEDAVATHLANVPDAEKQAARLDLVQKRIDAVNAQLASYESIKKFTIMSEPLSVENELLTASLKVRRKKVNEHFKTAFEAMYEQLPTTNAQASAS